MSLVMIPAIRSHVEDNRFPERSITNGSVKLTLLLPDQARGYYRGTRFDWSGIIRRAEYKGHNFFGAWRDHHDPNNHDDVMGPAEEFGVLGYAQAKPGRKFLKIGVGELEKEADKNYEFWHTYRIRKPGEWKVTSGTDWIELQQDLRTDVDWAYHYVKRIELAPDQPSFTIKHVLKNTGTKRIETDQYCHNFTLIDDEPIGPAYRVDFSFGGDSSKEVPFGRIAYLKGKELGFHKEIGTDQSVATALGGLAGSVEDNQATILNTKTGAGLRFQGDRPLIKYSFWATRKAACPEPFIAINLDPGQELRWNTRYTLFVTSASR
jgi:hypothetical protein